MEKRGDSVEVFPVGLDFDFCVAKTAPHVLDSQQTSNYQFLQDFTTLTEEDIDELIKESLKNKKTAELKVCRNLKADIMAFKTQKNAPEYTRAVEQNLIKKYVAKMEDAEKQYSQAGREDLATECREELEVLKKLLPKPVEASEIQYYIQDSADYMGWTKGDKIEISKKEMGPVIKFLKEHFPTADGKIISEVVKQYVV